MRKISIIVPVYNERGTIENFIIRLRETIQKNNLLAEYIIVDDNSHDGTLDILKQSGISVLSHSINLGYGAAIKTGINKAVNDIICIIDGDDTYSPDDISYLIRFIDDYGMVVGARTKGDSLSFPWYQRVAKGFICRLLGLIFRQKILDINSGLRVMKKDIIEKYLPLLPDGFSFTSSITLALLLDNYKIKYFPISYFKRRGRSKVRIFSYTLNFIKSYWRILYQLKFNKDLIRIEKESHV